MSKLKKTFKPIPKFKNEAQERDFWLTHDTTDYVDWSQAQWATLPNLKPSAKTISLRLPESMLNGYKVAANKRDVPYQSLIKIALADFLKKEQGSRA